ncbi:MAG: lysine--tRNA ligase [Oligoflexia bacterium]|nr:lysine--tRNA ligase [Oligoflexia bacterium]MBF0366001.1 lysine--tRNA ligase [Oligoflexia bacterium]
MSEIKQGKDFYIKRWRDLDNEQIRVRLQTEQAMREGGCNPYKNGYSADVRADELHTRYGHLSKEEIAEVSHGRSYKLAGRVLLVRSFGKAAFLSFDDGSSERFQIYIKNEEMSEESVREYKFLDYGDIAYAEGEVFKTNKGELSLKAKEFRILTKSLRPLPEKFHGLSDPELRYRMRYVDLVMNPKVRETFRVRAQVVKFIRNFFYERDYLEVETPMLHSIAGGAAARPFITHHNALGMDMFMRIAPELHLKRLITGGFQRVFEMNRCFRNEGLSIKHNPEFTSIEFYQAYATFKDLMKLTEDLLAELVQNIFCSSEITFGENKISFERPFRRLSIKEAVSHYAGIATSEIEDRAKLISLIEKKRIDQGGSIDMEEWKAMSQEDLLMVVFDEYVEKNLIAPTFITDYPTAVSPLSRRNDQNPEIVDRFELYINGWEIANAFSELNNPQDQLERFSEQAMRKEGGDVEACDVDYDYVRCLEQGMPPTAGEGIGIDRLCMLLTNSPSIRDVIFFPQLKREAFFTEGEGENESESEGDHV